MDTITIAENMVSRFQSEDPIVAASNEAGECHNCEKKLAAGIEACNWIFTAAEAIRAIYVHDIEVAGVDFNEASSKIRHLYEWWLQPCDTVEATIQHVENLNYTVANKDAYFDCKQRVVAKLRSYELRDFSLEANEDGFFDGAFGDASGTAD